MNVLITGNRGFIGRHFEEHFVRRTPHQVHGMDITGSNPFDVRDIEEYWGVDLVIHCAAVVGGRATIDGSPLHLMAENLSIDAALFRWALRCRPGRIVYFSSSAAYPAWMQQGGLRGGGDRRRLSEGQANTALDGCDQTYGAVKLVGERLAAEANAEGIPVHVFRPFSGYGPGQALDYPFPAIIRRAAQRETPFDIWGDPTSARDWVHVDDIVGAVLAAVDEDVRGPVNICTGRATTFAELAGMVMRREGYAAPIRALGDMPQGVHWRVGDPRRLHEFYVPRITLEEGIARALEERP